MKGDPTTDGSTSSTDGPVTGTSDPTTNGSTSSIDGPVTGTSDATTDSSTSSTEGPATGTSNPTTDITTSVTEDSSSPTTDAPISDAPASVNTESSTIGSTNDDSELVYNVQMVNTRPLRYNPYFDFVPMRALKESDDDDDVEAEARCLVVTFLEENGETNVIRGCAYESDDIEAKCREAMGDSYDGDMRSCRMCNGDLCNSSNIQTIAVTLFLSSIFLTLKMNN
ncbi:uncharacterized protein LOC114353837 [Ostrinia furnacalis]|uniref:uncharacterized protein LOC114353837 n=1 Tax=Ostrinia furnacalis TaxID=93504 RepID=UPI00103FA255|nr:uncharacterized protein LOC114353837 [Ostrinia furnacalis]